MNAKTIFRSIALFLVATWHSLLPKLRDRLRASSLLTLGLIILVAVVAMNPAKLGLMLWGVARIGVCAYIGYWIDRVLFPYARPHMLTGVAEGTAWKRRALIVGAAIVAGALLP